MANTGTTAQTASTTPVHVANAATPKVDTTQVAKDSLQRDSVAPFVPRYVNGLRILKGNDSTVSHLADLPVMEVPARGTPANYHHSPLYDTGSMSLLLLAIIFIVVSYRSGYTYMANFLTNMFDTRRRGNTFDKRTMSDLGIVSALVFNTCLMEGFLAFYTIGYYFPSLHASMTSSVFIHVVLLTGLALAFYLLQIAAYNVIGFVFGTREDTVVWISGFKASQSVLGILLFPFVVLLLVYPTTLGTMLTIGAILYICARIVFISKGFRIFFGKISAFVYFILYLCTVEIVPPVLFSVIAIYLCNILQS